MKIFIFILFLVAFSSSHLYSAELYEGKIILKGKKHIEAKQILIQYEKIYFKRVGMTNIDSVSSSDVILLKVKDGNYFPYGLVLGGLAGYGIYYGITPSPEIDPEESIYFAIAGLVLGGIGGALATKTTTIRLYNNLSLNLPMRSTNLPLVNMPNLQVLNLSLQL